MASLSLRDVSLDYPLYGAYDFSMKRRLLGRLINEPSETRIIRAIDQLVQEPSGVRATMQPQVLR